MSLLLSQLAGSGLADLAATSAGTSTTTATLTVARRLAATSVGTSTTTATLTVTPAVVAAPTTGRGRTIVGLTLPDFPDTFPPEWAADSDDESLLVLLADLL